ncbi:TIR domain-containing protein [Leifsonia sp. 21MFCrub1.1]|uniref:TIR domain-containing protein n=1 Tax=Leifsonia sp. 21MFCrub1.1 TaxID=1798223 RepID=UPI0008929D27|nr:TIR domain-containing protein [Leifsonia sp. 21MFCrub1.1]SEA62911.1 MTH538 TIR-like domain [Leifsonia sp. 21MFCrub1.1]
MTRRVFFSFRYSLDAWRVAQVKNMGVVEGQQLLTANEWEDVAGGGDAEIQKWIDQEMSGKSCNVVLIGASTAGRKWVNYEFTKAWNDGKGVVGIRIHNLADSSGNTTTAGLNPFAGFALGDEKFDEVVKVYNPAGSTSADVYKTISDNIESWVEEAIAIRSSY